MAEIAVLGLGAMGSRMARNLLKAGHRLTVWNRTPAAAESLITAGAHWADTPKAAVEQADFVIAMVRDDQASRQIWLDRTTGALSGMKTDAIAIESSTLTPDWIRTLGQAAKDRGIALLEAPVSGSLPQAETAQLIFLAGGDSATLAKADPILKALGSAIHLTGPLGSGALVKLATNTLLGIQVTVLAELIGMLQRNGADAAQALQTVAATPVWSPVAQRLSHSMLTQNFAPQFPIGLIEKDFSYTLEVAGGPEKAPTIAAAHAVFREAIDQGLGQLNMTGVTKLFSGKDGI